MTSQQQTYNYDNYDYAQPSSRTMASRSSYAPGTSYSYRPESYAGSYLDAPSNPVSMASSPTGLLPPTQNSSTLPSPYAAYQDLYKNEPKDNNNMETGVYYIKEKPACGKCCQKGCCCCCIYATWMKWTCGFIWLLVLAGVAVAAYFCWPRGIPPKVTVVSYDVSGTGATLQAVYPYLISVPVSIRIAVESQMLIPIPLDSIITEGFYTPSSTGQKVKVAGGILRDPYFAPQSTTTLSVPFDVNYTASTLDDPVITSLLQDCNVATSGGSGKIRINWTATVVAKLFTFARFPFSGSNEVDCPANSIGESLVSTAKSVLGSLGIDPNEVPDDPQQLLGYLTTKAAALGITIPPNTNILQLATQVATALGYDLSKLLNGVDLKEVLKGNMTSVTQKFGQN